MTESTPPTTPEQFRRLNRDLMEKVIDKAASDPEWKQRLLDDPESAMMEADFPEVEHLRQIASPQALQEDEVTGQIQQKCYLVANTSLCLAETYFFARDKPIGDLHSL